MRTALAALLLFIPSFLISQAKDKPLTISDVHADKFELLAYKERDLQQAMDKVHDQQRALFVEVCKSAGITAVDFTALTQVCTVDLQTRVVAKKEPPKPPEK